MVTKEFLYRGKSMQEVLKMSLEDFAKLVPSRERRKITRGFTDAEKKLIERIKKSGDKATKTHCRDMIILPEMIGKMIKVHTGKEWKLVQVQAEMLAHRLGEFAQTRGIVRHSAPGIGATRSSASLSVR